MPECDFQPYRSSSRQEGTITQWMDDKGFGWVESGGKRVFLDISDFKLRQRRPNAGEKVSFISGIDPKGRVCAKQVSFVKNGGAVRARVGIGDWFLFSLLLILPLFALLWLPVAWWMGSGAMAIVSAITYAMYAHDKQQAVSGGWRVTESWLHLAELLGGWPGAFLAQRRLRHRPLAKNNFRNSHKRLVRLFKAFNNRESLALISVPIPILARSKSWKLRWIVDLTTRHSGASMPSICY
jgi:uncharacterized membrane protein YsdA (DUF1294 family)/cold shock CspA family protein